MNLKFRKNGFSLTEVLLAVGTLAIGMSFVGGTFFVGIHLSTVATERTIAAVVADEAFAKIQLYGVDPASASLVPDKQVLFTTLNSIPAEEFSYPSTKITVDKQYYWSAICRRILDRNIQVTVFISRKINNISAIPVPVQVAVTTVVGTGNENKLTIDTADQESFINAGCTIAADKTGRLYRVVRRDAAAQNTITLDQSWQEGTTGSVWVVQPTAGGKNPCIAVYQREIRF